MTFIIILVLSSFLISLLGTRLTILALRKRTMLLDRPSPRGNHKTPTPRGGGVAVVMALVICTLVGDINYGVILAVFMLAAVSLLDDLIGVPVIVRLLIQLMAVLIPLSMMHELLFGGLFSPWVDKTLSVFLWLWFLNLFNFMDGIDGISAVEMICVGLGLGLLTAIAGTFTSPLSTYALIVGAAGCGFLWWNWHPARIFLGDVGSIPIGYLLGYLLWLAATSGYGYAAMILPAYYLSDGTITLCYRIYKRKKIWIAHSEHYYQKAVRNGRRHDTVARYIFGVNLLLILLATLSVTDPENAPIHLAVAYMAVFMMLGFFLHSPHNPEHEPF